MKKRLIAGVLSTLILASTSAFAAEGMNNFKWDNAIVTFSDVASDQWYYNDVTKVASSGIIAGMGDNMFKPMGNLTHAEAMTLMTKVYAAYHNDLHTLNNMPKSGEHWASGIYDYCVLKGLPVPAVTEFDTNITRGTMATFFYSALPVSAFEQPVSNDLSAIPEQTDNPAVTGFYKAGVMVGDSNGFRLGDSITRAEAAAIIHRVANPTVRVKVQTPEIVVTPGQVQTDKPYKYIAKTNWQGDPTGGVTITSQNGYINTIYGNHTYGCANQQEYDNVMNVIDDAYNYAKDRAYKAYARGGVENLAKPTDTKTQFYKNQLGIANDQQIISMRLTEKTVEYMNDYLRETYARPNGAGSNADSSNTNVAKWLFDGGDLDCDGKANLYMLCWDYLGFSTRVVGSYQAKHAFAEVYVNGHWVTVDQTNGMFTDCVTHEQLLQLIAGIKNDAYRTNRDLDPLIYIACRIAENGGKPYDGKNLSDLAIDFTPTHDPGNYDISR